MKLRIGLLSCSALAMFAAGCSGGGGSAPGPIAVASPVPTATVAKASPAPTSSPTATPPPTPSPSPTVSPTPTPIPTIISNSEVPSASDSLADSVGINDHTPNNYTGSDFSTIVSLEKSLGVRHLRDGILNDTPAYEAALNQLLNATGAKVDGITDCAGIEYNAGSPTSPASIQQFAASIGNRVESIEAPNEPDLRGDSNWVADTISCLPSLRSALPGLPFLGPALGDANEDAYTLGNISSYISEGNFHRYFAGRNPANPGWGATNACGVYGALSWALCLAQVNSGSLPLTVTETGWNSQSEVDETTQAKYLSRVFFVNLMAGLAHTYVYDLKDDTSQADASQDSFGGNGLLRIDDSLKPSYVAVKNLIATFSDPGTTFTPNVLHYALTNPNLDHALFQRRDGTYILALWNETPSWNPNTNTEVAVAPQSDTIDLEIPPGSYFAQSVTDTGAYASKPVSIAGAALTVSVDDHITLVTFKF